MRREFSAGAVLVRRLRGETVVAAIRPAGKPVGTWALPKGLIDPGETGEATALREAEEETGTRGRSLGKLGDVRYWYVWDGERVFKVVSFFLVRPVRGRIGALPPGMDVEVADARWFQLEEAATRLSYHGEREMAAKALASLDEG